MHEDNLHAPRSLKMTPELFATFRQNGCSDDSLNDIRYVILHHRFFPDVLRPTCIRYEWDEPSQTITVLPLPSHGHESVSRFIDKTLPKFDAFVSEHMAGGSELVKSGMNGYELLFPDGRGAEKGFDVGLEYAHPPPPYPAIVFEVGASESYPELKRDAWDWLWGTCLHVQLVILVKLTKPSEGSEGEFEVANWGPAYAEIWERIDSPESAGGEIYILSLLSFPLKICTESATSNTHYKRSGYQETIKQRGKRLVNKFRSLSCACCSSYF